VNDEYPPAQHLLRDLDFEATVADRWRHRATYRPAGEGATVLGGLLTVVDVLAGTVCMRAIDPDWMATSGMTFHLRGSLSSGALVVDASLLRAGRTTVTIEVVVEAW
jgi:acyl-coenzyme A thioesterase PaaI-like protein